MSARLAQELVSFAAIGSRLGAFKSVSTPLTATTRLGKAGQITKAAGQEALYGMAADAIKGLAGEGNLANMLEQVFPGLKDTWIMALAVDEDDNPYEAAVKSALDGAALGFPVGALGGVALGVRAAKGLPEAEAVEAFSKKFSEVMEQQEIPWASVWMSSPVNSRPMMWSARCRMGDFSRIDQVSDDGIRELISQLWLRHHRLPEDPTVFSKALGFNREMQIFGGRYDHQAAPEWI